MMAMIGQTFRAALRSLVRHKGFAALNIAGLALGLACFLLIVRYVQFERSYDRFHENRDRIYLVVRENVGEDYREERVNTGAPLAPLLAANFPAIESAVRFSVFQSEVVGVGEKRFLETRFFYADPEVFRVLSFPLRAGDPATALRDPFTVVLAAPAARKYFGEEDPIGKTLTVRFSGRALDFKVSGVLRDIPEASHLRPDFLASYASLRAVFKDDYFFTRHWDSPTWTYVLLRPGTDPASLERDMPAFVATHVDIRSFKSVAFRFLPLRRVYFDSPGPAIGARGSRSFVFVLSGISLFILLIACVNFMNLATARSEARAREIAIRKVVGGDKRHLIGQFLGESVATSLLALVAAVGLFALLRPSFGQFVGRDLAMPGLRHPAFLAIMLGTALATGLLAGAYPAFVLASLHPFANLKARAVRRAGGAVVRKALVVFQFALSSGLIVCALLMSAQVRHLKTKDVGFAKDEILVLPLLDSSAGRQAESFKARLAGQPGILSVAASSIEPGVTDQNGINLSARGNPDAEMGIIYVDHDFARTLGLAVVRGRDFDRGIAADASSALLLNEEAVRRLGWTDGVGEPVELFFKEGGKREVVAQTSVVGVLKDFFFRDLTTPLQPLFIKIEPRRARFLLFRVDRSRLPEVVERLKAVWDEFGFDQPFDPAFLDEDMAGVYRGESNFARIMGTATVIAVLIACLGLFGLASSATARRVREIGIRKVLGASAGGIFLLLSRDFLGLVLAANVVAALPAYLLMTDWLRNFAFRVSVGPGTFLLAAALSLAVALATVGVQALKAAWADPVASIRYE